MDEEIINNKLEIMNHILDDVHKIFTLLHPLIEKVLKEERKNKSNNNNLKKLTQSAELFGEIASLCKDLENQEQIETISKSLQKASYFI